MLTHTTPAGVTVPILTREEMRERAPVNGTDPVGFGTFAVEVVGRYFDWNYLSPRHGACHVPYSMQGLEPPPLPKPKPTKCDCGKPHRCGSCGTMHWIEVHGFNTGECSYCYACG